MYFLVHKLLSVLRSLGGYYVQNLCLEALEKLVVADQDSFRIHLRSILSDFKSHLLECFSITYAYFPRLPLAPL